MFFEFSDRIKELSKVALEKTSPVFKGIDELTEYNQQKVLSAFIRNRVDETDFNTSTGYGYGDKGREKLDVLADRKIRFNESKLERYAAQLSALSPLNVLERGYSITAKDNRVVSKGEELIVGDVVEITFSDTKRKAQIIQMRKECLKYDI